jgi:hypothetical protein
VVYIAIYAGGFFVHYITGWSLAYNPVSSYRHYRFGTQAVELFAACWVLVIHRQLLRCSLESTYSLSVSQSLQAQTPGYPVVSEVLQEVLHRNKAEDSDIFCWLPGHIILPGNGTPCATAKEFALLGNLTSDCEWVVMFVSSFSVLLHRRGKTNGPRHCARVYE